jgi:hypothetical protein
MHFYSVRFLYCTRESVPRDEAAYLFTPFWAFVVQDVHGDIYDRTEEVDQIHLLWIHMISGSIEQCLFVINERQIDGLWLFADSATRERGPGERRREQFLFAMFVICNVCLHTCNVSVGFSVNVSVIFC